MKKWLRRIRGAIGMGLTWAIEPKATKKARVYRGQLDKAAGSDEEG